MDGLTYHSLQVSCTDYYTDDYTTLVDTLKVV